MGLAVALTLALAQGQVLTGERSVVSKCEVAADAEYGHTRENPIKVGGTPLYGPARQRRFLQALGGPAGQPIAFKRRGSLAPNADNIILDSYEVTYAGLEKPIELFLDLYRWEPPKAPKGFVCLTEIGLAPPDPSLKFPGQPTPPTATMTTTVNVPAPRPPEMVRPDPDDTYARLLDVVLASPDVPAPIPLQPGSTERGMIFDLPRQLAIAARAARTRGETPTRETMPRMQPSFLIVANPSSCGAAASIVVQAGPSGRITAIGGPMNAAALREALPGVEVRDGAVGARFAGYIPRGGAVQVTFDGKDCQPERYTLATALVSRRLVDAPGIPPPGLSATPPGYIGNMTLKVSFAIGPDGAPFAISVVSGDARYAEAAIEAVRKWRFDMPMVNGAPAYSPGTMITDIVFR